MHTKTSNASNNHRIRSPRGVVARSRRDEHHHGGGWAGFILGRWPALVGLGALTSNAAGGVDPHVTAMIIILAAMVYLAAAALGSRRTGWPMLGVAVAGVVVAEITGVDRTTTLLAMGVVFAVVGLLRGNRIDRGELGIQTLGFAGFSVIALAAMMVGPTLAAQLAAAAAIGHGVWDVVHFRRDKVVERSLTEFCAVLDLGLGLVLLITTWTVAL